MNAPIRFDSQRLKTLRTVVSLLGTRGATITDDGTVRITDEAEVVAGVQRLRDHVRYALRIYTVLAQLDASDVVEAFAGAVDGKGKRVSGASTHKLTSQYAALVRQYAATGDVAITDAPPPPAADGGNKKQ